MDREDFASSERRSQDQDPQLHDLAAQEAADRAIADRLDSLEAEKVMARALELEADALADTPTLSAEQLTRVAEEVGVAREFVAQALGEVRLTPRPRGWFSRTVLPDDLFETATVSGVNRQDLDRAITKWMTQNEGLTAAGNTDDGTEWHLDRRWRARLLARSLSGGNRIAKIAGGDVSHRVQSTGELDHHLALESEGHRPLLLARLTLFAGAVVSALGLIGTAVNGDLAWGIPTFVALFAGFTWAAVAGARWWAHGIKGALRRSLSSIVQSAVSGRRQWLPRLNRPKRIHAPDSPGRRTNGRRADRRH